MSLVNSQVSKLVTMIYQELMSLRTQSLAFPVALWLRLNCTQIIFSPAQFISLLTYSLPLFKMLPNNYSKVKVKYGNITFTSYIKTK